MIQTIDMKIRIDGTWQDVPVSEYAGKKLGEFLEQMDGRDFRAKMTQGEWVGFFAGTDEIVKVIQERLPDSRVVRCAEALSRLRASASPLLHVEIPYWVASVFDGRVEKITAQK